MWQLHVCKSKIKHALSFLLRFTLVQIVCHTPKHACLVSLRHDPDELFSDHMFYLPVQAGEAQVRAEQALKEAGKGNTPVFEAKDLESITGKYHTGECDVTQCRILLDMHWRLRAAMRMFHLTT